MVGSLAEVAVLLESFDCASCCSVCLAKADLGCFFLDVMMSNFYVRVDIMCLLIICSLLCRDIDEPCNAIIERSIVVSSSQEISYRWPQLMLSTMIYVGVNVYRYDGCIDESVIDGGFCAAPRFERRFSLSVLKFTYVSLSILHFKMMLLNDFGWLDAYSNHQECAIYQLKCMCQFFEQGSRSQKYKINEGNRVFAENLRMQRV